MPRNQGNDRIRTLNLYSRGNTAAIIAPATPTGLSSASSWFRTCRGQRADTIDNATGDTAIDLMKLSAEEMQSCLSFAGACHPGGFTALGQPA